MEQITQVPPPDQLCACHVCGLIQRLPATPPAGYTIVCADCGAGLKHIRSTAGNRWAAALATAALAFYIPAMLLPMLRIERLGHSHQASLPEGIASLWSDGHWFIGSVLLGFSVLLPLFKLLCLIALSLHWIVDYRPDRALLARLLEFLGRWGMLDVMLVAVLVAFIKLGDLVNISPGSGAIAFTIMVLLSLLAGSSFNPHVVWEQEQA